MNYSNGQGPYDPHAPANAGTTAPDPDYASMSPLQLLNEKQKWFDMKAQAAKNTMEEQAAEIQQNNAAYNTRLAANKAASEQRTAAYQELNIIAEKALANIDEILTLSQEKSGEDAVAHL